eukprot:GHVS01043933.1.p2 GENE.GHVS01043933.1~~GHVS01043933.1.p2  ORF type:complete len:105 (+),score=10.53 GHVS01043933.1:33-347(+)
MCLRLPLTSQFPCHSPLIRAFLCGSSQSEECVFWSGHRSLENVPLVKIFYPSSPGIYTEHMVPVMRLLCFMYTGVHSIALVLHVSTISYTKRTGYAYTAGNYCS